MEPLVRYGQSQDVDPADVHPIASYFVCYTSRSGSTLLCDALTATGVAGQPEEYFHPYAKATLGEPVWREDWTNDDFRDILQALVRRGTTSNGIFGSKLMWEEVVDIGKRLRGKYLDQGLTTSQLFAHTFPAPRYLWVTRRDKVRQAVSLFRAKQSGEWIRKAGQPPGINDLDFNYALIDSLVRHIVKLEAAWAQYFSHSGLVPYTVVYEDLVLSYEATVRQVLNYLQIRPPENFSFPAPSTARQSDELSEDWVRRYYETDQVKRRIHLVGALPDVLFSASLRRSYLGGRLDAVRARFPGFGSR